MVSIIGTFTWTFPHLKRDTLLTYLTQHTGASGQSTCETEVCQRISKCTLNGALVDRKWTLTLSSRSQNSKRHWQIRPAMWWFLRICLWQLDSPKSYSGRSNMVVAVVDGAYKFEATNSKSPRGALWPCQASTSEHKASYGLVQGVLGHAIARRCRQWPTEANN